MLAQATSYRGCGENVVSRGVQGKSGDGLVVDFQELDGLRGRDVPNADGAVVRRRDDRVLAVGVVHHPRHLLGVALQDGNYLEKRQWSLGGIVQSCDTLRMPSIKLQGH